MILIGISGKKQSGKDTVAKYLFPFLPPTRTIKVNFADALKEEVSKATQVTLETIEKNKTIFRNILQWWGTDFRRNLYGKDYWISTWKDKILDYSKAGFENFICTDVRFRNEASAIKELNGILIRIQSKVSSADNHPSETELDYYKDFDYTIRNYGSLENLRKASESVAEQIMEQQKLSPH